MVFATYFCVMSLETVLPPVVFVHFKWNEVNVSYVYLGASELLIIMCIILYGLSRHVEDRRLALVGFIFLLCSYIWLGFATAFLSGLIVELGTSVLIIGVAIHVIGMPLTLAVTESLYTKMVPPNDRDQALSYLRWALGRRHIRGICIPSLSRQFPHMPLWAWPPCWEIPFVSTTTVLSKLRP